MSLPSDISSLLLLLHGHTYGQRVSILYSLLHTSNVHTKKALHNSPTGVLTGTIFSWYSCFEMAPSPRMIQLSACVIFVAAWDLLLRGNTTTCIGACLPCSMSSKRVLYPSGLCLNPFEVLITISAASGSARKLNSAMGVTLPGVSTALKEKVCQDYDVSVCIHPSSHHLTLPWQPHVLLG